MSRRAAFDPSRLDDELDDLLPPPTTASPVAVPPAAPNRPRRGDGGRPAKFGLIAEEIDGTVVSAVRIPKPLYDAVIHDLLGTLVERPSYAQIVAWTCEDHAADVVDEITHALATAGRTPRGRKLAGDGVAMTLRFRASEHEMLDGVIETAGGAAAKITRTAGVIAALRVAVKHGVSATNTDRDTGTST